MSCHKTFQVDAQFDMAQKDCVNLLDAPNNVAGGAAIKGMKGEQNPERRRDGESSIMTLNDNLKDENDEDEKKIIKVPEDRK